MDDMTFLRQAISLAETSNEKVKCGSVLVNSSGEVIASAYNSQHGDERVVNHAEMKSIAIANEKIGRKLKGVTAYGNCEPCTMCLTALIFAGVNRIVFADRLNDLVDESRRIDIDCFEFVKKFPISPKIEIIKLN